MTSQERINKIASSIRTFPDFPKPGINFRDIFSLTKDPQALNDCIDLLLDHVRNDQPKADVIVGIDSRGFIFGSLLAQRLKLPFVPIRKRGKLPGPTIRESFVLEYGEDCLEIQADACAPGQKVIVVDDLLATGGTLKAAVNLLRQLQTEVVECLIVVELTYLNGRQKISVPVWSMIND